MLSEINCELIRRETVLHTAHIDVPSNSPPPFDL